MTFRTGLKEGPFFDNIEWKIFKTIDDVKDRAEAYIRTKDFKNTVFKRFKGLIAQSDKKQKQLDASRSPFRRKDNKEKKLGNIKFAT